MAGLPSGSVHLVVGTGPDVKHATDVDKNADYDLSAI